MSLQQIVDRCLETGINCIAVADHGTIEGAVKMQSLAPFPVIVAEEILTPYGEIMGMFLTEEIPSGLSVEQTVSLIKAPCGTFRPSALKNSMLEKLAEQLDVVEVFNARSLFPRDSTKARLFAEKYGIPGSAGSDAHTPREIGNAYIEMPEFKGKDDFVEALAAGKVFGRRTPPWVHFSSVWARVKKKF
jgi:predicted metal-dependent phosphoesterase TrpH